jgi:predicted acyl esterase
MEDITMSQMRFKPKGITILTHIFSLFLIILLLLTHSGISMGVEPELATALQKTLDEARQNAGITGVTMAVITPEEEIWLGASGMSDLEAGTAMVPEDLLLIGSITKTFVSALVLKLAEAGKLTLEDSVEQWLPGLLPNGENITVRQLLNHTSGIFNFETHDEYYGLVAIDLAKAWKPEETVALATSKEPYFEPGTGWMYSNTNYILLGMIVEAATASTLTNELHRRLLQPLELNNTYLAMYDEVPGGTPHGYWDFAFGDELIDDMAKLPATTSLATSLWAAGAMISNAEDIARWADALCKGQVLSEASMQEMFTFVETTLPGMEYGLGIQRNADPWGTALGHEGRHPAFYSVVYYLPGLDITAVLLMNSWPTGDIVAPVMRQLATLEVPFEEQPQDTTPAGYPINEALYLTMRDGVDIAIDVWLPADLQGSETIPTVIRTTRYWRAAGDVDLAENPALNTPPDDLRFHQAGYAVVLVDARGSGASAGERPILWSADEVADMGEVVDWIVAQPWSNGRVGGYGVSYDGNTAELLTVTNHPAVRAVAPLYSSFNFALGPVGVSNSYSEQWSAMVQGLDANNSCWFVERDWGIAKEDCAQIRPLAQTLDANEFCEHVTVEPQEVCARLRADLLGVKPVDADPDGERLAEIVANRTSNVDVFEALRQITYSDEPIGTTGVTLGQMGPYGFRQQIESSGVPMSVWVGWLDANTVDEAISRYLTLRNPQKLIIGPFNHGGDNHVDPFLPADTPIEPTLDEQFEMRLQFFDGLLKEGTIPETGITYYTFNAGTWNTTEIWPPAGFTKQRWYFGANGLLTTDAPTDDGTDEYTVYFSATTGDANRWGIVPDVIYPDRAAEDDKLLTYTSVPLTTDVTITGHPIVTLHVASTHSDGAFHVYLEDVAPDGRVTYITEGILRAIHHKLSDETPSYNLPGPYRTYNRADASPLAPGEVTEVSFNLYATSVLLETGHRIRIAIAGADASMFERYPAEGTPVLTIHRNAIAASHVDLPMVRQQPPVDVNGDGIVDISDLVLVGKQFGTTGEGITGDVNGDDRVDLSDLLLLAGYFGEKVNQ